MAILCSLIVVGIAAGITFYFCVEYSFKDIKQQQIQECLKSGLNEENCSKLSGSWEYPTLCNKRDEI